MKPITKTYRGYKIIKINSVDIEFESWLDKKHTPIVDDDPDGWAFAWDYDKYLKEKRYERTI